MITDLPLRPKVRPSLPAEIARIYEEYYKANRCGRTPATGLAQRMESWLHHQVAADVARDPVPKVTLELGAGTLNQLPYEPPSAAYDVVEPFTALFEDSPLRARVRRAYRDISEVPNDVRYDRITSVATLEHVTNLPEVLARSVVLLQPEGAFRASIPSEGTILWSLGWRVTTGLEFRLRHGLDYGDLMRHEHVNTAREVEELLRRFFRRVDLRTFGPSRRLSLYQFFACGDPDFRMANDYLARLADVRS